MRFVGTCGIRSRSPGIRWSTTDEVYLDLHADSLGVALQGLQGRLRHDDERQRGAHAVAGTGLSAGPLGPQPNGPDGHFSVGVEPAQVIRTGHIVAEDEHRRGLHSVVLPLHRPIPSKASLSIPTALRPRSTFWVHCLLCITAVQISWAQAMKSRKPGRRGAVTRQALQFHESQGGERRQN